MLVENFPKKLYKYFSARRSDFLVDRLARYTPLDAFNDPFEGKPYVSSIASQEELDEAFEKSFTEEAAERYSKLSPSEKELLPYDKFERLIRVFFEKNKSFYLACLNSNAPKIGLNLTEGLNKIIGAFCLSEVPDDILMWAHYASSHEGFVIEFDTKHPYFNSKRSEKDELYHLRKVIYSDTRPSARLTEMEGPEFFLVKSVHWQYEREWRIFRLLSESDQIQQNTLCPAHLFKIPPDAITGVILGARANGDLLETIRGILEKDSELAHVVLQQAKPDESHFKINISVI